MWEKGEKIGVGEKKKNKSASEASREVVWDVERVVLSPFPGYRSARFYCRYFSYLTPFSAFFLPTAEPGPRLRVYEKRSKGTRKTGNEKLATCFATLLQNELNNDFARFTTHEKNLATSLSARQIRTPWLSLALK